MIPFGHPTSLAAGDTWQWRISFPDYPVADGWVLSYALVSTSRATQSPLTWDAGFVTDDGAEYTVTIPAATSDDFAAGGYTLTAYVTLAGVRHTVYAGRVLVTANAATQTVGAGLTFAETALINIEAVLAGRATADVESFQISGRALNRTPIAELYKMRSRFRTEVWRQRNPGQSLPGALVAFYGT